LVHYPAPLQSHATKCPEWTGMPVRNQMEYVSGIARNGCPECPGIRSEPQVSRMTSKIISILKKEKFPLEKAVLDHTGRSTFGARVNSGCVTGLSICYDKLTAEDAAELVIKNPTKRRHIILGSELGYGGAGHLSLVKVAWVLRMEGMEEEIEKVTWINPKNFFALPIK
jgi:predicted metal-dependent TIM-barrel fold hydrolase